MNFNYNFIPTIIATLVTLIGLYKLKYLGRIEYLIILILIANIIFDTIAKILGMQYKNNSFCYNLLNPIELFLTMFIYHNYFPNDGIKKMLTLAMTSFIIFATLNIFFIQNFFKEFDNYTFFAGGILVSIFSYLIWRNEIENNSISGQKIILWFAAANFIYYTTTIPILSANNWLLVNSKEMAFPIYTVNKVVYGIWALIIGIGFLWKRQTTQ